jgi:hypothetical protein
MRKLLSILQDKIHPWLLYALILNELVFKLQDLLLHWCARSGPDAIVIEELGSSDREMFRRVGLTLDVDSEKDIATLGKVRGSTNIIFSR